MQAELNRSGGRKMTEALTKCLPCYEEARGWGHKGIPGLTGVWEMFMMDDSKGEQLLQRQRVEAGLGEKVIKIVNTREVGILLTPRGHPRARQWDRHWIRPDLIPALAV